MNREADLLSAIQTIKESDSYSNPIITQRVIMIEESLKRNPEFTLYGKFVDMFNEFTHDDSIQE